MHGTQVSNVPGCRCDLCPLRTDRQHRQPIRDEVPPNAEVLFIGEAPGKNETEQLRPMVGASGDELARYLAQAGLGRREVGIANALLCRPPMDLEDYLADIRERNADIVKALKEWGSGPGAPDLIPDPRDCCRPRLMRYLAGRKTIIPLGGTALEAVTGLNRITLWRGSPLRVKRFDPPPEGCEGPIGSRLPERLDPHEPCLDVRETRAEDETWVLPTMHPAYALHEGPGRAMRGVIEHDVAKALRISRNDRVQWTEPNFLLCPRSADAVVSALQRARAHALKRGCVVAVDIETDPMEDPLYTRIVLVGVSWGDDGTVVVPYERIDGAPWWGSAQDRARIDDALRELLGDANVKKVFHNFAFDVPILERHGFPIPPDTIEDTMVAHHAVCSELPHSLAFIATIYTDARAWKEAVKDGGKWKPPSDEVYALYCARDALTTWRIWENYMHTELTGQTRGARTPVDTTSVYEHGKEVTRKVLIPLRKNGMLYDRLEGARISKVLREREAFTRDRMQGLLAGTDYASRMLDRRERAKSRETKDRYLEQSTTFHPGGMWAIRCALEALKIPIQDRTATGLLATGQDILAKAAPYADANGRDFVRLLIGSAEGKAGKIEAVGWRACVKLRTTYLDEPPLLLDGRIHADWRMLTHTGRFSTSPNCFDGETEVLTERGWIAFKDLDPAAADRVAQWSPDGSMRFVTPTAYVRRHADTLLHIRTRATDLMVTPDHRCLLQRRRSGILEVVPAREYAKRRKQIHAGVMVPDEDRVWRLSPMELRLLMATQADGHYRHDRHTIEFGFRKARKKAAIEECFAALGVVYSVRRANPKRPTEVAYAVHGRWVSWLWGVMPDKCLPWRLLHLDPALYRVFVDELFFWDGRWTRKDEYSSSVKRNVDVAQACLSVMGVKTRQRIDMRYPSARPHYILDRSMRNVHSWTTSRTIETVAHDGDVYCLSVPSSYLMVRRNGRVMITGQCQNWPAFMRGCFRAPDGYSFVSVDFQRVEWHVQALLSGDRALLLLFKEDDPHDVNAKMIFGDRYVNADKDLKKRLRRLAKCVTGDTRVPTEAGLLPVATLRRDTTSGLGTQPCAVVVAGAPGTTVRATQVHSLGEHPVVEVTTHCGYRIRCTPEHKFRTETGWVAADAALGSKVQVNLSADQPFPRHYVNVSVNPFTRKASEWQDQEPGKPAIVPITEAWGRLLGYYTGDGALVSGKAFHITTDGSRPEVVEDIGRTLLACGFRYSLTGRSVKPNAKVGRRATGKRVEFQVHSAEGVRFLEGLGIKHLSTGALVPWPIWESPRPVVQAFLQAYFESDGSVSAILDGRVTATSASQSFIREIQLLLAWLGVRTSLGTSYNALYNRDYYKVSTIGGGHRRFAAEVGFVSEFKRGRLAPAVVCDDEFYDRVESRTVVGTQPVFDLGVDDDSHCYTANGLVTHNSFVYGLGYGASDKTIWENLVTEWPDLQPREVSIVSKKLKKLYPTWFMWRDNLIDHVRTAGYIRSGITGRVRYFLSGMLSTEILNTAAQSCAADAANLAAVRLADRFEVEPRVKLVNQSHDSLTYEAPQDKAEWVKGVIEETMPGPYMINYNVPGYPIRMPVVFGVDVKIGKNWAEV